jgi:hypothetical protein
MRHPIFLLFILLYFLLVGCRKDRNHGKYNISGRLLESSSNPIPIKNYKLHISQKDDIGYFGGVLGVDKDFETDADGNFSVSYGPAEHSGLVTDGSNTYPILLSGVDTDSYKYLYPFWSPLTPHKDSSLNVIYLFKKIETLVLKIQFNELLEGGDSLEIIVQKAYRSHYKTIHGPVVAGTTLYDTISNFMAEQYFLNTNSYAGSCVLRKEYYQSNVDLELPPGDEVYREKLLIYP